MADILFKTDDFIFSYRVGGLLSAVLIFAFVNTLINIDIYFETYD